ncbi:MogA/MoaB family molybdenum cofactor biosynthesis protein [Haloplanus halophilus]|uniref:MogA/MoaB family molybdenum cofactor biosynthesis protein n=1 Tax=Haloplanus halophilus TaxID=2949993 RepID=UPI00203C3B39|nr:MogA/MoaB family molybdenum cofactor biosynthesis protein [Haloplanus sp. GDY1]
MADDHDHDHDDGDHDHEHHDDGNHDHEHHDDGDHDHEHHDDGDHDHDHDDEGHDHEHHHHDVETLGAAVLTVSTSRTLDDDPAGDAIAAAFEDAGHGVVTRELVGDDYDRVQASLKNLAGRGDVDVVVSTGGTGVTPDDVTVEAAEPLFEKRLPGFGELFRRLSYDEIGTKVVGTRAVAGVVDGTPVFCLPGSENAATLGAEEVVVPEAGHLSGLASRDEA